MKRRGFTLIEILAVIVILGIIAIIAIPIVSNYITDSRNKTYKAHETNMEEAAKSLTVECINGKENCFLPKEGNTYEIFLSELIEKGFSQKLQNPQGGGYCNADLSYVRVHNIGNSNYEYQACLYCGAYVTDSDNCAKLDSSDKGSPPVCGTIEGESSEWTNKPRTITVGCTDPDNDCRFNRFPKTYKTTTINDDIIISDLKMNTTRCPVDVKVDTTLPTCELERIGGTLETQTNWVSGEVKIRLKNYTDANSGLLTYGMGTSTTPDYNRKSEINLTDVSGLITVFGYVKDNAGNENTCRITLRTGIESPNFDIYYGYQIFPLKENFTANDIKVSNGAITIDGSNPKLTFDDMDKYTNAQRVAITTSGNIQNPTNYKLSVDGGNNYITAQPKGSKRIEFELPGGTYSKYILKLDNKNITINRMEIQQSNNTIVACKNVSVDLFPDPEREKVKTNGFSFDNGGTFQSDYFKLFDVKDKATSGVSQTKNDIGMKSEKKNYSIVKGDCSGPTITITYSPNKWTKGDVTLTGSLQDTTGLVGHIWSSSSIVDYSASGWEHISPTNEKKTFTHKVDKNGTYYLFGKDEAGNVSDESIKITNIDKKAPTCSAITGNASLSCSDPASDSDNGQSLINKYYWGTKSNPSASEYKEITTPVANFTKSESVSQGNGTTYYVLVMDQAGNVSTPKSDIYYTVTYNENGGKNLSLASSIARNNTNANLTPTVEKKGYKHIGWNTSSTATTALSSYQVKANSNLYAVWEAKTYTITYKANGGTGADQTQSVKYDSRWTTKSSIFTRAGYIMDGWSKTSNGGVDYSLGVMQSEYHETPTTLYAHWKPREFTVTYYPNGGSGSVQNVTVNAINNWSTEGSIFTKQGYNLDGWATSSSGNVAYNLSTNQGKYNKDSNLALYAHWSPKSYTITYTANGGSGSNQTQSVSFNNNFTTKGAIFTRTDYNLIHWVQRLNLYNYVDCLYKIYYEGMEHNEYHGYYSIKVDKQYNQSEANSLCNNSISTYKSSTEYARYVEWIKDRVKNDSGMCTCSNKGDSGETISISATNSTVCQQKCSSINGGGGIGIFTGKCQCLGGTNCNGKSSTSSSSISSENACRSFCVSGNPKCSSGVLTQRNCTCRFGSGTNCNKVGTYHSYSSSNCNDICGSNCNASYTTLTYNANNVKIVLDHAYPTQRYEYRDYGLNKQYQYVYPQNITLYAEWKEKATCPAGTTMVSGANTDNPTCCSNCTSVSNGSCTLGVDSSGGCKYTTKCNSGYTLVSGDGTNSPVCCKSCPSIANGSCSVSWNGSSCVYTTSCKQGYRLSNNGTTSATCTRCEGWRLTNPNDDVFNTIEKAQGQKWEYLTTSDTARSGWIQVHGDIYSNQVKSDNNGNGICDTGEDNIGWFYISKSTKILRKGWICDNDNWYYLWTGIGGGDFRDYPSGELSGRMVANVTNIQIAGSYYSFDSTGKCTAGNGCSDKCSSYGTVYQLD